MTHYVSKPVEGQPIPAKLSSFAYKMKADGMRTQAAEFLKYPTGQTDQSPTVQYGYDALNRLETESATESGASSYSQTYQYDLAGNRLYRQVTTTGRQLETTYDYYPGTDRLYHEYYIGAIAALPYNSGQYAYAYAGPDGGVRYQLPGQTGKIGQFGAFAVGLPSIWNRWLLIALMVCIPLAFLWPTLVKLSFPPRSTTQRGKLRRESSEPPTLSLYHRCMCVLLAYVFLITPDGFYYLSQAAVQYNQVSTLAWGKGNRIITYDYDSNGSLTSKVTTEGGTTVETVASEYNLQNRLKKATTTPYTGGVAQSASIVEYKYNPQGIRTVKKTTTSTGTTNTDYLIDPANPTGYAQVFEEQYSVYNTAGTETSRSRISYVVGDDVISQTRSTCNLSTGVWTASPTQYLLYDGHGSTRQLVNASLSIVNAFSYDGYGMMLGTAANPESSMAPGINGTRLLYSGEFYDSSVQQYNLRARLYDHHIGRFTTLDPYSGSTSDPQSLHKYLYCHANPINGIDPSGRWGDFTIKGFLTYSGVSGLIMSTLVGGYGLAKGWSAQRIAKAAGYAFLTGAIAGAFAYGLAAGIAAGAVVVGATTAEAAAVGWATVGLIGGPTSVGLAIANLNEAVEYGDDVDKTFAVVNLGLASFGFIASHWSAFNLAASATAANLPQSTQNYIAGDAAEVDFIANAQANGFNVVGRRVSVNTPFGRRQIDVVIQDRNGLNYGVEIKSSVGAFNRNDAAARQQFAADRYINQYGADAIGQNARLGRIEGTSKILWRPKSQ